MAWLTKEQEALATYMSDLSDEAYCAGWMENLEFVLWYAVLHEPFHYGRMFVDEQVIQQLKQLSTQAGGWIIFDDANWETSISPVEWTILFNSVNPERYLKYVRTVA